MNPEKRAIKIRQVLKLPRLREREEIRPVRTAAPWGAAATIQQVPTDLIEAVVTHDLLSDCNVPHGNNETLLPDRACVRVRVTGVVDVSLWFLHQYDGPVRKVVAVIGFLSEDILGSWVIRIDNHGVVDLKDNVALDHGGCGENAFAFDRGFSDFHFVHFFQAEREKFSCGANLPKNVRQTGTRHLPIDDRKTTAPRRELQCLVRGLDQTRLHG